MGCVVIFRFWNKFVRVAFVCMFAMAVSAPAQAQTAYSKTHIFEDDITLGAETAPITLVLYASPTCPHCKGFFRGYYPQLKTEYADTGHLRLIFREIATIPTDYAGYGSVLARCASEKYGIAGYINIFDRFYPDDSSNLPEATPNIVYGMAGNAGINRAIVDECLGRTDIQSAFQRNQKHAFNVLELSSTPGYVIDGEVLALNSDYSLIFRDEHRVFQLLDEKLAEQGIDVDNVNARKLARKSVTDVAELLDIVVPDSRLALEDLIFLKLYEFSKDRELTARERTFLSAWVTRYDLEWSAVPHYLSESNNKLLRTMREEMVQKLK